MSEQYSRVPLKIVSIYALIGCLWILLSDKAIWLFTTDQATISAISMTKGWLYVLLTALLLYALIERYISQIRFSENELKTSKETFLKAFTYSPLLMSISTIEDGRYIEVNNMFTQVTGFSRQETIGQTAIELGWISAANRELLISNLRRDGRVSEMELELTAKDGRSVYCLYSGEIVTIDGKERLLSIALDITARKKADRELKGAKNHLEAMMNALPDLMFRIDREGYIYEFRSSAMELLYVQPDMFLGKKIVDVLPEEPARIIMASLAEAVVKGYHRGAKYSLQMPQGVMWYELSIAAMGDHDKPETDFIMLAREITDRKVVEEAIRQSEEKFRSIVETSQEWIWETDLSWHHTYSNKRVADILGYSLDEFLGFNSMQLIHQEDRLELEAKLPGLVDRKEGWRSWVLRWRRKDGNYRYLESNAEPILNGSGELVGYRGSDRDITDRKNAEEKLRENEELFSLFMRYTPVYTFIKQIEGDKSRVIQLSDNFIDMLGKPADKLRGCTMDEMFPPDFARKITDDDIAVVKAGKNIQLDEELNGRSYVTIKFPIQREGKDNLLAGYTIDITERKKAEQAISQYADIVQNMQVGLYVYHLENLEDDHTLRLIAANPMSARLLGLAETDIIGSTIDEIFPDLRKAGIPEKFADVVRSGQAIEVEEFFYSDQNIKESAFAFKVFPLPDNCVGVLFEDITWKKKAETALQDINRDLENRVEQRTAELKDLNKELQAFNYSVSHDMRAPLIRIKWYVDTLFGTCAAKLSEEELQYISRLKAASHRLDEHIESLLRLYQIGQSEYYIESVNLSDLAVTILNALNYLDPERKVTFTVTDGMIVAADKMLMKAFLENLINNAWKYTAEKEDARIEVGVMKQDGREVYFVRDNGVGFDMDQVDNLFAPFLRLHKDDTGLGIGLASIQRIIRLHGGKIWAESRAGEGATFYFTLK